MTFGDRFVWETESGRHYSSLPHIKVPFRYLAPSYLKLKIITLHRNIIKWEKAGENGLNRFKLAVGTEEERT